MIAASRKFVRWLFTKPTMLVSPRGPAPEGIGEIGGSYQGGVKMLNFDYEALDKNGKPTKGQVIALNADDAIREIRDNGLFPISVRQSKKDYQCNSIEQQHMLVEALELEHKKSAVQLENAKETLAKMKEKTQE